MKKIFYIITFICFALNQMGYAQNNTALDYRYKDRAEVDYEMTGFTEVTAEAWVNLDRYLGGIYTASGSPIMMQRTDPAIGPHNDYGIILMVLCEGHYQNHDKQMAFGLNFGPTGTLHIGVHSGDTIRLNEWHHLAGTYDGTYMRLYIDGELVKSFDVVDSIGVQPLYSPDYGMYLGYRDEGQFGFLEGTIDELRIWDYARSESQIRETMYREITGNETGIHAYWDFNEGSGDVILDKGPNGFDGYLGTSEGSDIRDPNWVTSTAPTPYFTVADGNYNSSAIWASGQLAPFNDWARVKVDHNVNLSANETISELTISSAGAFTVDNTYSLTINGDFLIASDASGTGSFIDDGSVSYGSATVQRYLSEDEWDYVSSPVTNATAGVFTNIFLKKWDEPTETWSYITNIGTGLNEMQGYSAWASSAYTGADTVEFTGSLNTGIYSMSLTNTAGTSAPPSEDPSGYNFIGNPYPSGIDWDDASWTKTNVDDAIYMITYVMGVRQYASYIDGIGTHGATNEIAPHQGFFVKCESTSGGSIQVTNDARIHTSQEFFKATVNNDQILKLTVSDANGLYDETIIRAKSGATANFDGSLDALKLKGSEEIPQLYTCFDEETIYSINTVSEFTASSVIPLHFEAEANGIYELSLNLNIGSVDMPILLEDKKENLLYNLKNGGNYKFAASQEDDPGRFNIRFGYSDVQFAESVLTDALIFVKNQQIIVSLEESDYASAKIYDLSGRLIKVANLSKGTNTIDLNTNQGYLLVEVISPKGIKTNKVFLK